VVRKNRLMSDNIIDLSNIDSWDLMKELKSRGYYTDLIFGIADVDFNLEHMINSDREEDEKIVLSQDEKLEILENCFDGDWYSERMNDDVYNEILKYEK
jgi:hypothetical protein